jgi:hypothetical protein
MNQLAQNIVVLHESVPTMLSAWVWAVLLLLVIPLALTGGVLWATTGSVVGGPARPVILSAYAVILLVAVWIVVGMARSSLSFDGNLLEIRGGMYKQTVQLNMMDKSSLRVHDHNEDPGFTVRTNGVGLPGFQAGWFRDRQGAKVFVAYGGGPWLQFQTKEGLRYVVGVKNPEKLRSILASKM